MYDFEVHDVKTLSCVLANYLKVDYPLVVLP